MPINSVDFQLHTGDTSATVFISPSVLEGSAMDGNWSCTGCVVDKSGNKVVDDYAITGKTGGSAEFICYLTPAQTANLTTTGYTEYIWILQLDNATLTPPYSIETHLTIGVSRAGI
jgi:hypothetical protein